jgi:MFS family permease
LVSEDRPAARRAHQADAAPDGEHPVTFRDLFSVSEYRSLYLALLVNWLGDYLARAAITVLVYQQTSSVLLSAASFAVSYLPWLIGGPVLAALAERYPYRRVMVTSDLIRMFMIALVAIPGLPVPVILLVLFLGTLASPPTQAARSAVLPLLLSRERVVVALAVNATTIQAVQVVGYFAGATLATALDPRLAIAAVAVAFGLSALIILLGIRQRPAATDGAARTHLLRETGEGFRMVFGHPMLRAIALVVFSLTLFAIVPEGLAAAWAAQGNPDPATRGLDQGMIMAGAPVGWVIGGLAVSRLASKRTRQRLIRPLAVLAPLALVPSLAAPPAEIVALLALLSGVAQGGLMPTLQALFVLALPHGYRARAYGVMQGGMQLTQGGAVLITGVLADIGSIPVVVGLWSVGGAVLMGTLAARWPDAKTFDGAIAAAAASQPPDPDAPQSVKRPAAPVRATASPPISAPAVAAPPASAGARATSPVRAHPSRPIDLAEADETRRHFEPAEVGLRSLPARPAEAGSNGTGDSTADTKDLGQRLESRPIPGRPGSTVRVSAGVGRPPRISPAPENG